MSPRHPYADTALAKFLRHRILELRPKKSQRQIGAEAGFPNVNMISLLKAGASKLPLDRVPAMARALDTDPRHLLLLALDQTGNESARLALEDVAGKLVTANEEAWIDALREASDRVDPPLTARSRRGLFAIFGK